MDKTILVYRHAFYIMLFYRRVWIPKVNFCYSVNWSRKLITSYGDLRYIQANLCLRMVHIRDYLIYDYGIKKEKVKLMEREYFDYFSRLRCHSCGTLRNWIFWHWLLMAGWRCKGLTWLDVLLLACKSQPLLFVDSNTLADSKLTLLPGCLSLSVSICLFLSHTQMQSLSYSSSPSPSSPSLSHSLTFALSLTNYVPCSSLFFSFSLFSHLCHPTLYILRYSIYEDLSLYILIYHHSHISLYWSPTLSTSLSLPLSPPPFIRLIIQYLLPNQSARHLHKLKIWREVGHYNLIF